METDRFLMDFGSAAALFITAMIGCWMPWILTQKGRAQGTGERSLTFQLGNMLSGGVMLSAGFCHLLPTALKEINHDSHSRFPLAPFLCALGYLLTLIADQIAETMVHHTQHKSESKVPTADNSVELSIESNGKINNREGDDTSLLNRSKTNSLALEVGNFGERLSPGQPRVSFLTAVLLSFALSIHSVLEGAALGSQTSAKRLGEVFLAIVAHKGLAAYALGASLIDSETSFRKFFLITLKFSLASPIGIFLGLASGKGGAILSAIASGTFLYVAMMEVIPKELEGFEHKFLKLAVLTFGFLVMSILAIWA